MSPHVDRIIISTVEGGAAPGEVARCDVLTLCACSLWWTLFCQVRPGLAAYMIPVAYFLFTAALAIHHARKKRLASHRRGPLAVTRTSLWRTLEYPPAETSMEVAATS